MSVAPHNPCSHIAALSHIYVLFFNKPNAALKAISISGATLASPAFEWPGFLQLL